MRAVPRSKGGKCFPPYFYAIITPLSVRVSEDLATAYQLFFTSLYIRIHQRSLCRTACGERRGLRRVFATEWTRTGTLTCTGEVSGVYKIC